ncbi:cupin [Microtetraspora sp. NBRC 13810]|uniref:cupin domain-containing protein n=1 Tax=Microtetraspora sp. NBRC 13810 TaxID=3030990 RepID=UPI0024A00976|nr:cupin domain-containing protein [Microtetraspora sp. NBRC 13810]GLW06664.1 cupin [Microtetraspora sp. NBRC 13810]
MRIVRGTGGTSERRSETFTGEVWADPLLPATSGVTINNVFFTPGARTHWHRHEGGQILHVTAGGGFVCAEGGRPYRLRAGDTVWTPAHEMHWHGADEHGYLLHTAVSLGSTVWDRPVTGDEYTSGDAGRERRSDE